MFLVVEELRVTLRVVTLLRVMRPSHYILNALLIVNVPTSTSMGQRVNGSTGQRINGSMGQRVNGSMGQRSIFQQQLLVNSIGQLRLPAREENSMRFVVRCIEFLTCHVPRTVGVSFYQILPGISDASLPRDHTYKIMLSFSFFIIFLNH